MGLQYKMTYPNDFRLTKPNFKGTLCHVTFLTLQAHTLLCYLAEYTDLLRKLN